MNQFIGMAIYLVVFGVLARYALPFHHIPHYLKKKKETEK